MVVSRQQPECYGIERIRDFDVHRSSIGRVRRDRSGGCNAAIEVTRTATPSPSWRTDVRWVTGYQDFVDEALRFALNALT